MIVPLYDDVEKRKPPIVTGLLIFINLMVFVYQFRLSIDDPSWLSYVEFIKKWGVKPVDVAAGKYATLYTSMFLHADFMHFLGNMVVLWAFSWTLEELLGSARFAVIYLASGLAAAVAWCVFNAGSEIPCVGASGAIAGMIGAYSWRFGLSTRVRCMIWFFARPHFFYMSTMWFAAFWVAMQLIGVMTSSSETGGGVAWFAHLGGFMAGLIMLPILDDNSRELKEDKDGSLSIADLAAEEAQHQAELKALEEAEPEPILCQTCETELEDEHLIAPNLFRCPNGTCGQLNMDPKALPPKKQPVIASRY